MKNVLVAFLLVVSGLASQTSLATLYRWVDKDGNVSYQDQPPPASAAQVQEKHLDDVGHPADSDTASDVVTKYPVTLYAVPHCEPCDLARSYLKKRNIPFNEVNVATDPKAQDAMRKTVGDLSVPTITVGSKVMKGYMESLLSGELDDAGYPKMAKPAESGSPEGSTSETPAQ